jgi:hypothetical protein
MARSIKSTIIVKGLTVSIINHLKEDYISITDIARQRDAERSDYILQNWLRNRSTIEFVGLWEQLKNPNFNSIEFDGIKNKAGSNSFSLTPKRWRNENTNTEGNIRDQATIEQLLVLANIESMNAEFIRMEIPQGERLLKLNKIAITQLKSLTANPHTKQISNDQKD